MSVISLKIGVVKVMVIQGRKLMSCGVRLEVISGLTVHMHRRIWVRFGMSSDNNFAELL